MDKPITIHAENLSDAWRKAFLTAYDSSAPMCDLTVSFSIFGEGKDLFSSSNTEVSDIRKIVDETLFNNGLSDIHTVANTIFPASLWNSNNSSQSFYNRYFNIWKQVRKTPTNRNGTYFQRMIAYGWEANKDLELNHPNFVNQLKHVIQTYKQGNTRRSALAVSIFNPFVDHTHQKQKGFPCLQHIHFIPDGNELIVTGVYATQLLLEKGYGNYLGLYRLGQFMSMQLGLTLKQVRCKASQVKYAQNSSKTEFSKTQLKPLVNFLKNA